MCLPMQPDVWHEPVGHQRIDLRWVVPSIGVGQHTAPSRRVAGGCFEQIQKFDAMRPNEVLHEVGAEILHWAIASIVHLLDESVEDRPTLVGPVHHGILEQAVYPAKPPRGRRSQAV